MAAPLNKQHQTGNLRTISVLFALTIIAFGALLYSASLPSKQKSPADTSVSISEVKGATTDEYIPEEDIKEPDFRSDDSSSQQYLVTAAIDGDTIKVRVGSNIETVRLIGLDTPETKDPRKTVQCFGKEAAAFTSSSLLNKQVRLAPDSTQDNRDKYGRLLRYVYLADGTLFNYKLVREGYAYEYTYRVAYRFQKDFITAQQQAEYSKTGLWSPNTCNGKK